MSAGHLWINEKRYNKSGRVGGKTLIGNWQEEQRLEVDVGLIAGTVQDTNKKGAESTPFLISSIPQAERHLTEQSETRGQFNKGNSDVTLLRPPKLGVRSMLRAQAILDEAKERVADEEAARRRSDAPPARSTMKEMIEATGVHGPLIRTVDPGKEFVYMHDTHITTYTGDPTTGEKMPGIPGQTSVAPGAPNPAAKNHGFTMDKYVYALSRA